MTNKLTWYLEWCDIKLATAENYNKNIWKVEVGTYTDLQSAYDARIKYMSIHKDRYYKITKMKKKSYVVPAIEVIGIKTESMMITASVGRTTTNKEASSGNQGSGSIPGGAYANENDVGTRGNLFDYDWE